MYHKKQREVEMADQKLEVYLTVADVAKALQFSPKHVLRLVKIGQIKSFKTDSGSIRFTKEQLKEFVQGRDDDK